MAGRRSAAPWGWLALVALALAACGTATESSPTLQIGSPAGGGDAELAAPETVGGDAGGLAGDLGTVDAGAPIGDAGAPADTHPNTDAAMPADAAAAGDAVVAADGAVVQDSAGPADGSSGADAPAPPDASPDAAVALDSAVVVDAVPPGDSGPAPDAGPPALACGNGLCQGPTETALTCPSDCATGWQACANGACQAAALACSKAVACSAATACAANCKDLGCVSACTSGLDWAVMTALLVPLASCAQLHGCLAAAPPGPGAGPSTCKNGACDGGETHLTCPSDCPFPVSASELCQTQKCGQSFQACAASAGCVDAAVCWNKSFDQKCLPDNQAGKTLSALIKCVQSSCAGVLPVQSCAGKCGQYTKDAACQCDSKCKQYNDCCPDINLVCDG